MKTINRRRFLKTVGTLGAGAGLLGLRARLAVAAVAKGAPHAEQLGWQLACNAYSFNKLTLYETIGKVAGLGLKYTVGFNWQKLDPQKPSAVFGDQMSADERRETKKRLADAGVKMPACYCRKLAEADACRRLFDFCREMGIGMIVGEPPFDAYDMLEKLCNEYEINLAVHNHAKPSPYWEPETLLKILQGRGRRIGACCDTGHWIRSELSTVETLAKFQDRLFTMDLKDIGDEGFCVPYGTGKGNVRGVLHELHRQRFRGLIGIEYSQRSPNGEAEIAQCVAFFEQVRRELANSKQK
ncbi:MAG: sugar phosphate isomerase/epimerase [Verrucomicrobia bacterium]|nr:sugar phosphate isomerase/epimerase [Verrucomicrobiota bacterium]